ncbi:DNA polymerase kappa subunit [Angomonas deanei]|uniref:ImpB/mucB/samB family C-terminal domain containing protein, putative n=1 Tax=Angomonas deanei TaxID=59799 RepID=A0A7G2CJV5_9TRYP|nr:DNA polymerase kappa subunit [Angomonas deanei]CAD2218893.1 impB/mucB/samB family C-terminal domain containing protein, putative [Angomonas deanei]|eukprot:EPY23484.1 DNA polymerase kappa subunit [Angomonas deanei]
MLELSAHLQREYPSLFEVPRGTDTLTVDSVVFPIFDKVGEVVQQIRSDIHRDTQLTASAGMAITSTLAKIGSNYNKPNGQKSLLKEVYTRGTVMDFFGRLKVKEVPGVGASSEFILNGLGIFTFHDFYEQRYRMGYLFTRKTFLNFLGSAIGICGMYAYEDEAEDDKPGEEEGGLYDTGRKTIGQERTFYKLKSRLELQEILLSNIEKVHERLTRKGLVCGQVVLKMKHTSFQLKQYSKDIEVFPPSNSNHTTDKPHYYEYEDKFYTDDLEQLKANGDVLLLPLVEHYAEYRLLGFTAGKLLRKEALLRILESSKRAKKQQKTLQDFLGNRKRARTQGAAMEECICISSESDIEMEVHHHDPQEVVTVVSSDTLHESPTDRSNEVKDVQKKEEHDVIFID